MKIITVFLLFCLIFLQVKSSDHLHFLRKVGALVCGVGIAYKVVDKDRSEKMVKVLHEMFGSQIEFAFHTKWTDKKKHKQTVCYPAYALRGILGFLTFKIVDSMLNHEYE